MDKIQTFIDRLERIGITILLRSNVPWIYLYSVNGNRVMDKYHSDYGFTIAMLPIKKGNKLEFTDIGKIFDVIRKYL